MTVAIEFDVPIDVADEMAQAIIVVLGAIERVEKPAEHLRDDVFAAVEDGAPIRARATSTGTPTSTSERNFSKRRVLAPKSPCRGGRERGG
jgi:hypothetical protein